MKRDQRERSRFLGGKRPFGYQINPEGELVADERSRRLSPEHASYGPRA